MIAALGFPMWDFYDTLAEYVLTPVYALWILALTAPNNNSLTKRLLSTPPFRFLGEISYSVYCLHAPILYLAGWTITGQGVSYDAMPLVLEPNTGIEAYFIFPPWAIIPLIPIILVLSSIAYFLVEKPAREWLNSYFSRKKISARV